MGPLATLAEELESLVVDLLAAENARTTLTACSLVSKRWLHISRRALFSDYTFSLSTASWRKKHQVELKKLLDQTETEVKCTFWPYIRSISIEGDFQLSPTAPNKLISLCLAQASNLQDLRLERFYFAHLSEDAISRLAQNRTICSLHLLTIKFLSVAHLCKSLGLFRALQRKCILAGVTFIPRELEGGNFIPRELDLTSPCDFSPPTTLKFFISTANFGDVDQTLKWILHVQWNITKLELLDIQREDYQLITPVLKHIGASLRTFDFEHWYDATQDPISFSHNKHLEKLRVRFMNSTHSPFAATWLTSTLRTIDSREHFRQLETHISFSGLANDIWKKCIAMLDWESMENILLDQKRFPSEPTLLVNLNHGFKPRLAEVVHRFKTECMPTLSSTGGNRLVFNTYGHTEPTYIGN